MSRDFNTVQAHCHVRVVGYAIITYRKSKRPIKQWLFIGEANNRKELFRKFKKFQSSTKFGLISTHSSATARGHHHVSIFYEVWPYFN